MVAQLKKKAGLLSASAQLIPRTGNCDSISSEVRKRKTLDVTNSDNMQKMSEKVLFIKVLLVHCATQSLATTLTVSCNEDVLLKCRDVDIERMDFLSVAWYQLSNQKKRGIIRRGKADDSIQDYNFTRPARFGGKYGLFLSRVTPEDSGRYECAISANVGGQNRNCEVKLIVHDECVTQADLTTMTSVLNVTQSSQLCIEQVEGLPVMWSIMGYVLVGLAKIILSLISIWVIRAVRNRSARRRQFKW